jgi:hypothetical protein
MDASIQSHGCECIAHNLSFKTFGKLPSMALDSGFPRQSLTGAGSAGMTRFLALAEASLLIRKLNASGARSTTYDVLKHRYIIFYERP